jgi:hypothetical protein
MSLSGVTPALPPEQQRAYTRFGEALLAFSDEPTTVNLARYLAASQALDDTRRIGERNADRPWEST